jgi:NAD-dependent SIR2 family protein deacetylase
MAHPELPTIELHGYLRALVCVHCHQEFSRAEFQDSLARLNPAWAEFLARMLEAGALDTENPTERRKRGLKTNPDGDVDLPDAPYTTFRYPPCSRCLAHPPTLADGSRARVAADAEGAWAPGSTAGVLKPAVIMFGESIKPAVKSAAEEAINAAARLLVVGSSLATYSAWRLVKQAKERGMPIGVLNMGGVRGEENFFAEMVQGDRDRDSKGGALGVRCSESAEKLLPQLVESLSR